MRIKTSFTIKASSKTSFVVSCGWTFGREYPLSKNLSQGTYQFIVSSYSGEPLLELTQEGELEPLARVALPKIEGQEDTEINAFQAYKEHETFTKYLYNLFAQTDLRFKIVHFTGTDSISDLVTQTQ